MSQNPEQLLKSLSSLDSSVMHRDLFRLRRQWQDLDKRRKQNTPFEDGLTKLAAAVQKSQLLRQQRQQALPKVSYPEQLPIANKREEISKAIAEHQVVVVAGETGSGKTTQLPKICLELGRGVRGLIGHTQPRRIAARTVADRIASELETPLGEGVGYQVRFTDHSCPTTHIKLMTDGILLAEIQHDRFLSKYDTLIIDEAHERSLNIDFLMGYLKTLLPKRPDLKVIITSATIDLEKFSKHFSGAPIIQVSGRTFPVETIYRPSYEEEDQDQVGAIVDATEELLQREKGSDRRGGDILVFLSGEREIRETAIALRKANIAHLEILPLYARLSLAEQNKVFQNHKGRRIVLATNVAETSITVPGVRYVIDPGTARISRYSYKTKVQRLPIEAISQASANQRKGRCGRVSAGVCVRLYDEEDFNGRPEFTDAEIVRTNLAAVILQMLQLRIGDIRNFPFVDMPDSRLINDGYKLLEELEAIDSKGLLSALGKKLCKLNIDPGLARMVLAAAPLGVVDEILVITSALSIQDPRERPQEKKQQADENHRRFKDEKSDFIGFLNLWDFAEQQRQELSQGQWRKQCKREFLSFLRLREWRDIHRQLKLTVKELKLDIAKPTTKVEEKNEDEATATSHNYENIHRALLSGLLGRVGNKAEEREYLGARNRRFHIFPGSYQNKKQPKWLVAAELLETSRLFAHTVAKIEPEWVLSAAEHLLKRSYFEPHYNSRSGQVMAFEKVSLYGLVLLEKNKINYSQIDPIEAREIFIRSALVEGQYPLCRKAAGQKAPFFKHNTGLIKELHDLEAKSRRRDLLVDDEVIFQFYNERVDSDVVNVSGFEHWRKRQEQKNPELLFLQRHDLMQRQAGDITEAQFPNQIEWEGISFKLSYHFDPQSEDDGVSLHAPVGALHLLSEHRLQWLVPGLLREKCIALVKGLPKQWRKNFVPVPAFVDKALAAMTPANRPLVEVLGEQLKRHTAIDVPIELWSQAKLDSYYLLNIKVEDDRGKLVEQGRYLPELRERYKGQLQQQLQDVGGEIEQDSIDSWNFDELPETWQLKRAGVSIRAYPALVDQKTSVAIKLKDNPLEAQTLTRRGLARLFLLQQNQNYKYLQKNLIKGKDLGLTVAAMGSRQQVMDDVILAAACQLLPELAAWPRQKQQFEQWQNTVAEQLVELSTEFGQALAGALEQLVAVKKTIKSHRAALAMAFAISDINEQLKQMFEPGVIVDLPLERLRQYSRFLKAVNVRLEKAPQNIKRDRLQIAEIEQHWQRHQQRLEKFGLIHYQADPLWQEYRWLIEEFRISLFAQTVGTLSPVSSKRLNKLWQEILDVSKL